MNFDQAEVNFRNYKGLSLHRTDPYGFWVIDSDLAPEFKQSFTMLSLATKEIDAYLSRINRPRAEVPKVREKLKRI